ncbi:MAG: PIN domain-containing protein [Methanothrix sp.]|nr:PIN domain-containing protein [Methanothrix sp.]
MDCMLPKYRPSKEEFQDIWKNCMFVPDTSLLLGLFRYSPNLRESIIGVFERVPERLWIPYQVAFEYHNNWENVVDEELKKYNIVAGVINECSKDISTKLNKKDLFKKYEATSEITEALTKRIEENVKKELEDAKQYYPKKEEFEEIHNKIIKLFAGKVGAPYSLEKLEEICKIGSLRYELKLPPGYEDRAKGGIKSFGDLIVWFQTMDLAKKKKRPIILILDDLKEDWWWIPSSKIVGPRPELINEFTSESEMQFYMYSMDQFLKYAKEYIDIGIKENVIEEAQEYRGEEEKRLKDIKSIENLVLYVAEDFKAWQDGLANISHISEAARLQGEQLANFSSVAHGLVIPKLFDFSGFAEAARLQGEQLANFSSVAHGLVIPKLPDLSRASKAVKQQNEKLSDNSETAKIPEDQPPETPKDVKKSKNDVPDTPKKEKE